MGGLLGFGSSLGSLLGWQSRCQLGLSLSEGLMEWTGGSVPGWFTLVANKLGQAFGRRSQFFATQTSL